jgi:hypothetical protein
LILVKGGSSSKKTIASEASCLAVHSSAGGALSLMMNAV